MMAYLSIGAAIMLATLYMPNIGRLLRPQNATQVTLAIAIIVCAWPIFLALISRAAIKGDA